MNKYRIQNTTCIYILSLKLLTNTLSTNTKINLIYLSNIQYVKNNNNIKFIPYFNHKNYVKNKKIFFKLDIIYLKSNRTKCR